MQMPKSKFPNDYTFSRPRTHAPYFEFGTVLRATALLVALVCSLDPQSAWASTRLGDSLLGKCARAPEIVIQAQSNQATIVKNQPRGARSAIRSGWKIQGLTKFDRDTYVSFDWEKLRDQSGTCLRLKRMEVTIGDSSPKVWLAPAVARNACLKEVVLAHELKHVAHHKAYSDQLKRGLKRKLGRLIRGRMYRAVTNPTAEENAKKAIERIGRLAVLKIQKPLEIAARKKDRGIDTPQNYAKELGKCGL